jgi:hypothetical protein
MNRYVIARVDTAPTSLAVAAPPAADAVQIVELIVVDRRTFFQTCFHTARSIPPRPPAPRAPPARDRLNDPPRACSSRS